MTGKMKFLPLAGALLMLTCAYGCSNGECNENRNSLPYAAFYASGSSEQLALDSISIYGIGAPDDAMLADTVSGLDRIYLPFNIESRMTSFVFRYENKLAPPADTVTFSYQSEPYFVSEPCGAVYLYHINYISTTHHAIDSVVCPRGIIDNVSGININVYFRTQSSIGEINKHY